VKVKSLQIAQPSQTLEGRGSTGMTPQVQLLQLLQCAEGLQAAEAEECWVVFFKAFEIQVC
jgi:hypothetical protein